MPGASQPADSWQKWLALSFLLILVFAVSAPGSFVTCRKFRAAAAFRNCASRFEWSWKPSTSKNPPNTRA